MAKDTKKQIIETAISLFRNKGLEETTINDICEECHITKGTFYYHFSNKNQIVAEFYRDIYSADFDSMISDLVLMDSALEQLWEVYAYGIKVSANLSPQLLKALYLSDFSNGLQFFSPLRTGTREANDDDDICFKLIRKGQKTGEIRQGDPHQLHLTFMAAQYTVGFDWAFHDGDYDETEIIYKMFLTVFQNSAGSNKTHKR